MNNLKKIRESQGVTLDELAARCGTSRGQIWYLEQQNANPRLKMAIIIAERLGRTIDDVWQLPPLKEERELIQIAIKRYAPFPASRRAQVEALFGVGSEVAERICWKYGFNPDREV